MAYDPSASYDNAGRLTGYSILDGQVASQVTWSFTRNPASQLTSETRDNDAYRWAGQVAVSRPYTVNGLNQYTLGGPSFCYDMNGNLTADGSFVYLYDIENRLLEKRTQTNSTCASLSYSGTLQASLRYDPLGRLHEVVDSVSGTIRFLYDGDAIIGDYDGAGTMYERYVHGVDAGDDPLINYIGASVATGTGVLLYKDVHGSIVGRASSSGGAMSINSYDEYGIPGANNQGLFQYTGQAWLPELGHVLLQGAHLLADARSIPADRSDRV
jgi:YD repeat-containing protein